MSARNTAFFGSFVVCLGCSAWSVVVACGGSSSTNLENGTPDGGGDGSSAFTTTVPATSADGSAPVDSGPDGATACTDCTEDTIHWEPTGGFVFQQTTNELVACGTFTRTNQKGVDPKTVVCTTTVATCGNGDVTAGQVQTALRDPVVVAAFAADKTPIFGCDTRATDGQILEVTVNGKSIDIGNDGHATGGVTCYENPDPIKKLKTLLEKLTAQELAKPACKPAN